MTANIQKMWLDFQTSYEENADPRIKDLLFMSSPGVLLSIVAGYLYFCTKLGPRLMKGRKPFELKTTLIVYNACQVLLSCYMVCEVSFSLYLEDSKLRERPTTVYLMGCLLWLEGRYNFFCHPIDYSYSPVALKLAVMSWVYFVAKLTELLDTLFFVLRKKYNQVTFLHLYHHASMPVFTWMGVRYFAGGHNTIFGLINSFVHIIMYSYYLLTGLGPEFKKYLWWKQHLTSLQLIQFAMVWFQNVVSLYLACDYPVYITIPMICNSTLFMYLFGKFYVNSYYKGSRKNVNTINGKAKKM